MNPNEYSGTKEWTKHYANFISGCENNCLYCFSRAIAVDTGRKTSANWHIEVVREKDLNKNFRKRDGRIMFPSSHDITPQNLDNSINFIHRMLKAGNELLIVSKPHLVCIERMVEEFSWHKKMILFRFSIGSADNRVLKFWEPGAPSFEERIESLKLAYENGFSTSVSCEPMLDAYIDKVIDIVKPFVTDAIWLGKMNRLKWYLKIGGITNKLYWDKADELERLQSDENIMKLYEQYKDDPMIKWKGEIKEIVGIPLPEKIGEDM